MNVRHLGQLPGEDFIIRLPIIPVTDRSADVYIRISWLLGSLNALGEAIR